MQAVPPGEVTSDTAALTGAMGGTFEPYFDSSSDGTRSANPFVSGAPSAQTNAPVAAKPGGSGGASVPATAKEAELARKERDLERRQAELQRREAQVHQSVRHRSRFPCPCALQRGIHRFHSAEGGVERHRWLHRHGREHGARSKDTVGCTGMVVSTERACSVAYGTTMHLLALMTACTSKL